MNDMQKAVKLFKDSEFTVKELINALYTNVSLIKQCFRTTTFLLHTDNDDDAEKEGVTHYTFNHQSHIYPTNLFLLRDRQQSLLITISSNRHTTNSWTIYSPFNNVKEEYHNYWLPKFVIHQTPLLISLPVSSMQTTNSAVRWLICLRVKMLLKSTTSTDPLILSLHPHIRGSCTPCPTHRTAGGDDGGDYNRVTTTNRGGNISSICHISGNMTIYLCVHLTCGSNSCILHVYNPLNLSFNNLIHNYYDFENYFFSLDESLKTTSPSSFPLCIYPFCKQWSVTKCAVVTTTKNEDNSSIGSGGQGQTIIPPITGQELVRNSLEKKLNEFCAWSVHPLKKGVLYFIKNGIFRGLCLSVSESCASTNNPLILLEVRSSSHDLLDLFDQFILSQMSSISQFQQLTPYYKQLECNETNLRKSITHILDSLITETQFLINSITQVIEQTMHKRIPKLPVFLKDITNNLDIVNRSAEWRSMVNSASNLPIDDDITSSAVEYSFLRRQTDASFECLCLEQLV
ncbi:unnamed protein product [Heterobilharzia americana]|nr:unnamed protein product [Heterobilharzia americana]